MPDSIHSATVPPPQPIPPPPPPPPSPSPRRPPPILSTPLSLTCPPQTSGAADAGPLAEALVEAGFRLDAVVAVVDAEAGPEALKHPVARAQVGMPQRLAAAVGGWAAGEG